MKFLPAHLNVCPIRFDVVVFPFVPVTKTISSKSLANVVNTLSLTFLNTFPGKSVPFLPTILLAVLVNYARIL